MNDDVIIIYKNEVRRMSAESFNMIMHAAGNMRDDWDDVYESKPKKVRDKGRKALDSIAGLAL